MYQWFLAAVEEAYEPVRLLKETPRGTIRLIRHRATGRRFVLHRFTGNGEVYRELMDCACKNLPQVYEVAEEGEQTAVLEEFIEGDTLDSLLRGALFTPRETRRIIRQLCQALWVLHSLGAVHRDIKPDNVILRRNEAILIDFDAARLYKPECQADTQVLGTIGYAAPEQFGLSQSDVRTDIYALGILMNIMLTGEHPSKKLAGGRLGWVVERCTQVNPDRRYKDVVHLMEEL